MAGEAKSSLRVRSCPSCGSKLVGRSRRRGLIESLILPLLFIRPYRCEECHYRYLGIAGQRRENSPEPDEHADQLGHSEQVPH